MSNSKNIKKKQCPKCGSMETHGYGTSRSTVALRQKHHCRGCGLVFCGDIIEMNKEVKQ